MTLLWSWNEKTGSFTVKGFGGKSLVPTNLEEEKAEEGGWFTKAFTKAKKPRALPSAANPSELSGVTIDGEEDVLHLSTAQLQNLPGLKGVPLKVVSVDWGGGGTEEYILFFTRL